MDVTADPALRDEHAALAEIRARRDAADWEAANAFAARAVAAFPEAAAIAFEHAMLPYYAADFATAAERLPALTRRFPAIAEGWMFGIRSLRAAVRMDEASRLADEALATRPDHAGTLVEAAEIAWATGNPAAVVPLCARARAADPSCIEAHILAVRALRIAGDGEAARAIAQTAIDTLPPHVVMFEEHLAATAMRGNQLEILRQCDAGLSLFPDHPPFLGTKAITLITLGRPDDSEAVAEAHIDRFPNEPLLAVAHAMVATWRRDFPAAVPRWARVRARFPQISASYERAAEALLTLGRYDEAETIIAEGHARFPHDRAITYHHALSAARRRDWPEAIRRWEAALAQFPNAEEIRRGIGETRMAIDMARLDGHHFSLLQSEISAVADATAQILAAAGITDIPDRHFFLGFEGLGDTCAFGGLQRIFGAEPLGLLRWASATPSQLVAMLRTRFAGVGLPENTFVDIDETSREYYGGDRRYFRMHSFVQAHDVPPDKMLAQMARRLRFLKDKIIENLEAADTIFVYTRSHGTLSDEEIHAIHDAIQTYGTPPLLCVRRPSNPALDGTTQLWAPTLAVGSIAALESAPNNVHNNSPQWVRICRDARALLRGDSK
jgi:tetratricopeptide (TPR) repeat protein